jgi:hypothetical protein
LAKAGVASASYGSAGQEEFCLEDVYILESAVRPEAY